MQRYFINQKKDNYFILNDDDTYHITKVMRMNVDELVEVVYEKKVYICKIKELNKNVLVEIVQELEEFHELPIKVTICQSLVNEQKMDLILQKDVELGAYSFIPYQARNSVIKENGKGDKKVVRWQRIVKEASEQSKRNIIPIVKPVMSINELIKQEYDLKLLCSVNEKSTSIKNIAKDYEKYGTMIIVIGPEGGFSSQEEDILMNSGFIRVSLGDLVLRTETASIVALSYINYELMR